MTRLADLLGRVTQPGTAPYIDRQRIRRRVARRRMVRRTMPVALGSLAVALTVVVAMPLLSRPAASDPTDPAPFPSPSGPSVELDPVDAWWGDCRSQPRWPYPAGPTENLDLAIEVSDAGPLEPDTEVSATVTLTALADVETLVSAPDLAVLFGGAIIATLETTEDLQLRSMTADETIVTSAAVPLTRCTDGQPLPPGTYEVIASQRYSDDFGSSGAGDEDAGLPPRVTSESVTLVIAGDPVGDPFGIAPIFGPDSVSFVAPEAPENLLSVKDATAILTAQPAGPWDMAPGSSRWVIDSDIPWSETFWSTTYNQCAFPDGTVTFPETSYVSDLYTVALVTPPSISVRYGWVVVGDPIVGYEFRNNSDWYISGGWEFSYAEIYLARDGVLVAIGRVTPITGWYSTSGFAGLSVPVAANAAEYYGLYAPREVVAESLLWRELYSCDNSNPLDPLPAGTYTVLTSKSLETMEDPNYGSSSFAHVWTSHGTIEVTKD